jgi:hypothetical protein
MNKLIKASVQTHVVVFLLLFFSFTSSHLYAQTTNSQIDISTFDFLIGEWEADFGKFKYYEKWQKENDRLSAQGYRVKEGQRFDGEKLMLINIHGYISYIATVGKQQPILFALKESSDNNYIFENKEHDFPQRIVYTVIDENNVKVFVEGDLKGESVKDEYNMTRVVE